MPVRVQQLVESFLSDITLVIPEQADGCIAVREALIRDADGVIRGIVKHLGSYDEAIVARNDSFLVKDGAEVIPGIKISEYWEELSDSSKDTVWKYLNLILLAGAKHIRSLDRREDKTRARDKDAANDTRGEDIASDIAKRLRDPEVRDKVMETIRETMASIPDETDEEVDPMEKLKAIEGIIGDLKGTQIGKIIEEIASDLSGDISPEALGFPSEMDMKSMNPQDLIGLLAKPDLMKKIMNVVGRIGDNLNKRMESGEIDREVLAREGQDVLAKSQDLLKSLSPQAAQMLAAMGGGKGVSARKLSRAMEKMGGKDLAAAMGNNTRNSSVRDRLRKKLVEREKAKDDTATEPMETSWQTGDSPEQTKKATKKPSKKSDKKRGKKHR